VQDIRERLDARKSATGSESTAFDFDLHEMAPAAAESDNIESLLRIVRQLIRKARCCMTRDCQELCRTLRVRFNIRRSARDAL